MAKPDERADTRDDAVDVVIADATAVAELDLAGRKPRLGLVLVVAGILAVVSAWFAPAPWPTGEGELRISHAGELVHRAPVVVGEKDALRVEVRIAEQDVVVARPAGVPVTGKVKASATVEGADPDAPPSLDFVRLDVVLP